eukprot:scaffold39298_cov16-Prasinocladus_malaysianus.AAC.2
MPSRNSRKIDRLQLLIVDNASLSLALVLMPAQLSKTSRCRSECQRECGEPSPPALRGRGPRWP